MRNLKIILSIAVITIFSLPNLTNAESSKKFASMAKATWSAFECSSLASITNDKKEQERLFLFGYDQGKKFIAALQNKKVEQKDLSSEAPFIMLLLLQGPTPDFMLGRIFESAQDSALEDIYKTGEHFNSDEEQFYAARNKFSNANCQFIGK